VDERRAELSGSAVGGVVADQVAVRWEALGPAVAARLAPSLEAAVDDVVAALGDAILACLGDLSAASAEGVAGEPAAGAGDRGAARRLLLVALLRAPAPSPPELARLCAAAGWARPRQVAALAVARAEVGTLAPRLPADALVAALDDGGWALLPDPDAPGRAGALRRRMRGVRAALGPTVELAQAAESARWARLALTLARDGAPALIVADDRPVDLLLGAAPALAARLERTALAPLAALPPATRERLLETLEAWLRHRGAASPAAAELHVHAQTIRYRVGRLRALLGERLDDPEGRLELELALRARRLAAISR